MKKTFLIEDIIKQGKSKKNLSKVLAETLKVCNGGTASNKPHHAHKKISMNVYNDEFMNINTGRFDSGSCNFIDITFELVTGGKGNEAYKVKVIPFDEHAISDPECMLKGTINNNKKSNTGNTLSRTIYKRKIENKDTQYLNGVNSFIKEHLNRKVNNIQAIALNRMSGTSIYNKTRRNEVDGNSALIKFDFHGRTHCLLFIGSCVILQDLVPEGDKKLSTVIDMREYFNKPEVLYNPAVIFKDPLKAEIIKLKKQLTAMDTKSLVLEEEIKALKKKVRGLEKENTILRSKATSELAC